MNDIENETNGMTMEEKRAYSMGYERAASIFFSDDKSLRDEFAMAAMTGLYSGRGSDNLRSGPLDLLEDCKLFYEVADAMLAARKASAPQDGQAG